MKLVSLAAAGVVSSALIVWACGGGVGGAENGTSGDAGEPDARPCHVGDPTGCSCDTGPRFGYRACDSSGHWTVCDCSGDVPPPDAKAPPPPNLPDATAADAATDPPADISECAGAGNVFVSHPTPNQGVLSELLMGGSVWSSRSNPDDFAEIRYSDSSSTRGFTLSLDMRPQGRTFVVGTSVKGIDDFGMPAGPGLPAWDLVVDGQRCGGVSGTFWIGDIAWQGSTLVRLLAAFQFPCIGALVSGCVSYRADAGDGGSP